MQWKNELTASHLENDSDILFRIDHIKHSDDIGVFQRLDVSLNSSKMTYLEDIDLSLYFASPDLVFQTASPDKLDGDFDSILSMYS